MGNKDKEVVPASEVVLAPEITQSAAPAEYELFGLDKNAVEVYFPETARDYVLAKMTQNQLKQLFVLESPHVRVKK